MTIPISVFVTLLVCAFGLGWFISAIIADRKNYNSYVGFLSDVNREIEEDLRKVDRIPRNQQ